MMELKGEEAGLKCQLSGATCWFRIEISISQGLGIVSLVFQVYLLLSGSSNISNSKNKFSISHCLSLTITLPKVLRCWWLHTNQILCSKVHDKFPTKVQDYRLAPRFFELCQYPRLIENDNWTNEMTFLRGTSALLERSGFTLYCSSPKAHRYWWLSQISFLLRS